MLHTYICRKLGNNVYTVLLHEVCNHLVYTSKLTVVSCEAKKKQHTCTFSGLCDHYSEIFAALKFADTIPKPP